MLRITFVLCERMLATSLSLPMEQLHAADSIVRGIKDRSATPYEGLEFHLVSVDGKPVQAHTGLTLPADKKAMEILDSDIIYLPALWRNPRPVIAANRPLLKWLRENYERGCIIAGVGTGCWLMAEAGILDNKAATTHWHYFDDFQKRYPLINLKRQHFITKAGNLYCTGSVNSLANLTIHFIQRYFSRPVAKHVERHFFHEIRDAYESSRVFHTEDNAHPDEDIIQIQLWLQDNLAKDFQFREVAQQFGLSLRNFNRRFKQATGETPLAYLQKLRMEAAKELLQTSNLSIAEVMDRSGYSDTAHFTQIFKRFHTVTPRQYRTTVRAKLFTPS